YCLYQLITFPARIGDEHIPWASAHPGCSRTVGALIPEFEACGTGSAVEVRQGEHGRQDQHESEELGNHCHLSLHDPLYSLYQYWWAYTTSVPYKGVKRQCWTA